jgi:hypothetical protein
MSRVTRRARDQEEVAAGVVTTGGQAALVGEGTGLLVPHFQA